MFYDGSCGYPIAAEDFWGASQSLVLVQYGES